MTARGAEAALKLVDAIEKWLFGVVEDIMGDGGCASSRAGF